MKYAILLILVISLSQNILSADLNAHVSSKDSKPFEEFLKLILSSEILTKEKYKSHITKDEIKENSEERNEVVIFKDSSFSCNTCVHAVSALEVVLNHSICPIKILKAEIVNCDTLKLQSKIQCKIFYATKGFRAIVEIQRNKEPLKVCEHIGFCLKKTHNILWRTNGVFTFINGIKQDNNCTECQNVVKYYEEILDLTKSLSFLFEKFSTICKVYQTQYQEACRNYFKDPIAIKVWTLILQNASPLTVCQAAGSCPKSNGEYFRLFLPKLI